MTVPRHFSMVLYVVPVLVAGLATAVGVATSTLDLDTLDDEVSVAFAVEKPCDRCPVPVLVVPDAYLGAGEVEDTAPEPMGDFASFYDDSTHQADSGELLAAMEKTLQQQIATQRRILLEVGGQEALDDADATVIRSSQQACCSGGISVK